MPERAASPGEAEADPATGPGAQLVTGGGGFAGRHLVELLGEQELETAAPARAELDLLDRAGVADAIADLEPSAVFHLAAFSSPQLSWERPEEALLTNLEMTLNLLEAVRSRAPEAAMVLVTSGQVYGQPDSLPVEEDAPLRPGNPYAVSKVACDLLGRQYAEAYGMRVVRARPFNHAGPGQADEYVLSSLARQVAEAEAGGADEALLRVGDTSSARDFSDVRDVVRAYVAAAAAPAGAYNVCSSRCTTVLELIEMLGEEARVPVRHEVDPARLRAHDASEMRGSHERLTAATGWEPRVPLGETVRATLEWWRAELSP